MAIEQAHKAVSSAESALQSTTERVAEAAHDAVEALRGYGESAEEYLRIAGENSRAYIDKASAYIEAHPMAAISIAAAIGFTLGALTSRPPHNSETQMP
ncbi:MAG: hypothetical protein HY308_02205 [Gammaproteobacteria bacterium]|nr:hypothetical protein [Gammaproteobacteria bacterium]